MSEKGYIWTGGNSTSKERGENSIPPTPIHFIYDIFKLKLGSTPIFKFK